MSDCLLIQRWHSVMQDFHGAGLHVPNWIVQPFNLSFEPDDLHIMAFVSDHPEYEAVEAMIRFRDNRGPRVRAILTRHDQSQVDHSNDEASVSSLAGERERFLREFTCVFEELGGNRRAMIRFESFCDELVELDVTSFGPPDATRGGLTDPGRHSLASSLPVMARGRSALAAPSSRVMIGGRSRRIPPRIEAAGRVIALEGFLTEMHHMAAIRSSVEDLELIDMPATFKEGDCWIYRSASGLATYRLSRVSRSGDVEIARTDTKAEWIRGKLAKDRLAIAEVRVKDLSDPRHFASLTFSDGAFAIGIDGADGLVTGTGEALQAGEGTASIALIPSSPFWAAARPVTVALAKLQHGEISIRTMIGKPSENIEGAD